MDAIAGKPAPTSAWVCRECSVDANSVGARLAGEGDFMDAIASKPAPTSAWVCRECSVGANPVGARLAGEGDFMDAIAGKRAGNIRLTRIL
ncbi:MULTISPECIES: hypothetical protein [unclassified Pseudomonas]|uniref:hypothetical protein n=1 Tax=unclassified Pseudomonas TaxID=196821 RepID=UPI0005191189|nr:MULTISPECIES: hypothetical protein [unclassified Pseudomonas]